MLFRSLIGQSADTGAAAVTDQIVIGRTATGGTTNNGLYFPTTLEQKPAAAATIPVMFNTSTGQMAAASDAIMIPSNADPNANITGITGLLVYDSTDNYLQYYNGTSYVNVGIPDGTSGQTLVYNASGVLTSHSNLKVDQGDNAVEILNTLRTTVATGTALTVQPKIGRAHV